jgi:hypothetical protein
MSDGIVPVTVAAILEPDLDPLFLAFRIRVDARPKHTAIFSASRPAALGNREDAVVAGMVSVGEPHAERIARIAPPRIVPRVEATGSRVALALAKTLAISSLVLFLSLNYRCPTTLCVGRCG